MAKDVKVFVHNCLHCVATIPGDKVPRPLGAQLHATKPNEILHFDFLYIELSRDGKYQYLLLLKDDLSGYLWLVPCRKVDAAATVDALMRWHAVFDVVLLWISHRGSHFKNEVIRRVQKELKAKHHFTTADCPWSNGTIESACKQVIRAFRAGLSELKMYADECPEVVNMVLERPEQFFIDVAEQWDAYASLHWTRGDYTARADVEGQRACQRASGLHQNAESYGG
jgi:hypothetical protein